MPGLDASEQEKYIPHVDLHAPPNYTLEIVKKLKPLGRLSPAVQAITQKWRRLEPPMDPLTRTDPQFPSKQLYLMLRI